MLARAVCADSSHQSTCSWRSAFDRHGALVVDRRAAWSLRTDIRWMPKAPTPTVVRATTRMAPSTRDRRPQDDPPRGGGRLGAGPPRSPAWSAACVCSMSLLALLESAPTVPVGSLSATGGGTSVGSVRAGAERGSERGEEGGDAVVVVGAGDVGGHGHADRGARAPWPRPGRRRPRTHSNAAMSLGMSPKTTTSSGPMPCRAATRGQPGRLGHAGRGDLGERVARGVGDRGPVADDVLDQRDELVAGQRPRGGPAAWRPAGPPSPPASPRRRRARRRPTAACRSARDGTPARTRRRTRCRAAAGAAPR